MIGETESHGRIVAGPGGGMGADAEPGRQAAHERFLRARQDADADLPMLQEAREHACPAPR